MTDNPILTVEASYRTDATFVANAIELDCHEFLKPAPNGIYCSGKLEPAMVDAREFYYKDDQGNSKAVVDINKINTAIYDSQGKCVIPSIYMKKRDVMVSNTPFMPYRGMHIVKDLVVNQIDRSRTFKKYPKERNDCLKAHLKDGLALEAQHEAFLMINELYSAMEAEIYEFLANYSWNMFFVKIQNTRLILERSLDWRAYCWMCEHEETWRNGKYQPPC